MRATHQDITDFPLFPGQSGDELLCIFIICEQVPGRVKVRFRRKVEAVRVLFSLVAVHGRVRYHQIHEDGRIAAVAVIMPSYAIMKRDAHVDIAFIP